jgi:di/tricarboxylate transporter
MAEIGPHGIAVLLLTIAAFVAFALQRLPIETTALLVIAALALGFALFPYETASETVNPSVFFLGFGHEALVAICGLMVLGQGLTVTGALEPLARRLSVLLGAQPRGAMLVVLIAGTVASGFINDTPVVMPMLPILTGAALKSRTPPGKMLMPANYAVRIGGMGTTIGTSTNLLVVAIAADLGVRQFGMFDFFHLTAIAAVLGILYLWLIAPRLLPTRETPLGDAAPRLFRSTLTIEQDGPSDGASFAELRRRVGDEGRIVRIRRENGVELARLPSLRLHAGDQFEVVGPARLIAEVGEALGATAAELDEEGGGASREPQQMAEVVVTENSPLNGQSVRSLRIADDYGVVIVALHRPRLEQISAHPHIADVTLRVGDVLLVQGTQAEIEDLRDRAGLLVLTGRQTLKATEKAPAALAIFALCIALAAFKVLPISVAATMGVALMILARCVGWRDIGNALSGKVIRLVVSSLALGSALVQTGTTTALWRRERWRSPPAPRRRCWWCC